MFSQKKSESEFTIFTTYVDDMNLIGAPGELLKALEFLVNEFKNERHGK